jgi:translocation and assembly module TamB
VLDVVLDAEGSLEELNLEVKGTIDSPWSQPHSLSTRSRISFGGVETSLFELSGPDLVATGSGSVDWEEFRARLDGVKLTVPGTELEVAVDLAADLETEKVEGHIFWTGFAWPLREESAQWLSREGDLRLSGTLDEWRMEGQVQAQAAGYPEGRVVFDAMGDRGGLEGTITELTGLGGRLAGTGSYRWDDGGLFAAEVELEDLETSSLLPDYPAVLSGAVAASGRLEPLAVNLDIRKLKGTALGRPVAAVGRLEIADGVVRAEDLRIESGASSVRLDGYPDNTNGLAFDAKITSLGDFLPDSSGALDARGTLLLVSGWPRLSLEARGRELRWQDMFITSLAISGDNRAAAGLDTFDIDLLDSRAGEIELGEVGARLKLGMDRQSLEFSARSGEKTLNADLAGTWIRSPPTGEAPHWIGELRAMELAANIQDRITLNEPAPVLISAERFGLDSACFSGTRGASACLDANWSVKRGVEASARIEQLSLEPVQEFIGLGLILSQQADGEIKLTAPPAGKPSGSAEFRITAGSVAYPDDPDPIMETGPGRLAFELVDGRLTSGVLDLPIAGQGLIDVDYHIPDVTRGLDAELGGTILLDLSELDLLSALIPAADQVSGSVKADLEMSGTLGQPWFSGRFDLRNGVLGNRATGLKLEEIELSGDLKENGQALLTGGFRAQEGRGELKALIDLRDVQEPRLELDVSGRQLKLFDSRDLVVVIDPDLNVTVEPGSVTLGGSIHVPSALIAPAIMPAQTVSESEDLVIVAGRPAGEEVIKEKARPLAILGDLAITLGEDVKLDVTVAKLDVDGGVDFNWTGQPLPGANGNFSLLGEIVAFGQRLEIAQGDISFPNVPADNPHLNIRAERQIYGNSEVRRAGLLIAGTVQRPVMEPYTDPMTNRDRAQTLLVTGSDFNMERGVGAVDIGTYIAPKIFVSYGVGVFDDSNVISIRYDLGSGWGVKATSGERQTGVDVSYTLEN